MSPDAVDKEKGETRNKKKTGSSELILKSLVLGIFLGLFFGEHTENLKFIGDIYVGLMQMTILPYVVFALIGNLGRLSLRELQVLATSGLRVFLGLWAIAAFVVFLISQSFPAIDHGQYFSSAMIDPPPKLNWLGLFVPSNPFRSLAENSVPAVVVFCILFGIAVIGLDEKKLFLDQVSLITKTLHRVNGYVMKLTPIGVFAISAHAAGVMTFSEFERLQGYYLTFGVGVLLLSFMLLPMLVACLTPFSYFRVLKCAKDSLLTAFVTGSVFPVIPLIMDGVNSLFEDHFRKDPEQQDFPGFILPLAYPFPDSGNVIDLIFIPFAAWFLGSTLGLGDNLYILFSGFFLLFGKVFLTIPFLLNSLHIPQDMFQLFLAAGVIAARVGDVLSSMHYLVFTVLTTAAMVGVLKFNFRRFAVFFLSSLAVMTVSVFLVNHSLVSVSQSHDNEENPVDNRSLITDSSVPAIVIHSAPNPYPLEANASRLERIKKRGFIRVGFKADNMPYSYYNASGRLVGLDIDLARRLARDLHVVPEFVEFDSDDLVFKLRNDHIDIAMSGLTDTLERSADMLMTEPYLIVNLGLVIPDHKRKDFESEDKVNRMGKIKIAVINGSYFARRASEHFPNAEIVEIDTPRQFFEDDWRNLDALSMHAESGAAWTMKYPGFTVVNPLTRRDSAAVSIAVAGFDTVLDDTLNTWIRVLKMDGTVDRYFDHWMLGKDGAKKQPRWSILRNVLHIESVDKLIGYFSVK